MEAALLLLWVLQRHLLLTAIAVTSHTACLCIYWSAVLHFCEHLAGSCIPIYRLKERRMGKEKEAISIAFIQWCFLLGQSGKQRRSVTGYLCKPKADSAPKPGYEKTTKPDAFSFQVQEKKTQFLAGFLASSCHSVVQALCSPSHQREQVPMPAVVCTSCPGSAGSQPSHCLQSKPVAVSPFPSLTLPLLFMYLFRLKTHITRKTVARETRC